MIERTGVETMTRKILSIILCSTMLITTIPSLGCENEKSVKAAEVEENSRVQVGSNVYATLDDDATVTISGQGDMWENTHMEEDDYAGTKKQWVEGKIYARGLVNGKMR